MEVFEIEEGVYVVKEGGTTREFLATVNLVPSKTVYGERLILFQGREFRLWDPYRSKLAAGILKGLQNTGIVRGARVLYLGASTGTTVSHVSDIVDTKGIVFAVEVSPRVARELIENVAKQRKNVIPIVEDARKPEKYSQVYGKIEVVYCDIAQPDQTEIAIMNANRFLTKGGRLILVVKARSIDVLSEPKEVIKEEVEKVSKSGLKVMQVLELSPYDKDHGLIIAER